jgi:dihydrofolate reductase
MKVTLWMATSLNGIIARKNNEEDFISHDSWLAWLEAIRKSGCLVWGRKTYEIVKTWPKEYFDDIKGIYTITLSSNKDYKLEPGFDLANSPEEAVSRLEKKGFTEMVVTGGSKLNSSFAKAGLIDKVVLNIEPNVIGEGIPLFNPEFFDLKLEFIQMEKSKGETIQLHYKAIKN